MISLVMCRCLCFALLPSATLTALTSTAALTVATTRERDRRAGFTPYDATLEPFD